MFSQVEEYVLRIFNTVLDLSKEEHSFPAINDPMVVGECHVHDGSGFDLVAHAHGSVLDGVHAQDCALRRVDDGGAHHGAEDSAICDGEGAACHVFELNLAVSGFVAHVDQLLSKFHI